MKIELIIMTDQLLNYAFILSSVLIYCYYILDVCKLKDKSEFISDTRQKIKCIFCMVAPMRRDKFSREEYNDRT